MNTLDEYLVQAKMAAVRQHAEGAYRGGPRRGRRRHGLSRHRFTAASG